MLVIGNHKVTENIYQSNSTIIYRAVHQNNGKPVILKFLNNTAPSPIIQDRFNKEYQILTSFSSEHIITAYGLEKYEDTLYIVMEDFYGTPLSTAINEQQLRIGSLLKTGIALTHSLEEIHRKKIIHGDICPANILVNQTTGQQKIIDFSTSRYESDPPKEDIQGSLAYIAPEQTGRIDQVADYRADFYSLGATLYHLLTGTPPFQTSEPLEMIHFHLAKTPALAHKTNPNIPSVLSDILAKLMAKSADNRYQSSKGIRADLQKCLDKLKGSNLITPFELGEMDIKKAPLLSEQLIGRKTEFASALDFLLTENGKGAVLISGEKGQGKTFLVNQIGQHLISSGFYYYKESYIQNNPSATVYGPIITVLNRYIRSILADKPEKTLPWKKELQDRLDTRLRILTEIFPHLQDLTEHQDTLPVLPPQEALKRFISTLSDFIAVSTQHFSPLILLIEDIHWAKIPFFELLKNIVKDKSIKNFYFIFTCRDTWPIHQLESITPPEQLLSIPLSPLTAKDIYTFLHKYLKIHSNTEKTASILFNKTDGVPQYLKQTLYNLHQNQTLKNNNNGWSIDINGLEQSPVTSNVSSALINQLEGLDEKYLTILQALSCSPDTLRISLLTAVVDQKIGSHIKSLIQKGFLIYCGNHQSPENERFVRFSHPRLRAAVYNNTPTQKRKKLHHKIGVILFTEIHSGNIDDKKLLEVADQLNASHSDHQDFKTKDLVSVNLKASKKAKAMGYAERALRYARQARINLPKDAWETEPKLAQKVYMLEAKCAMDGNTVEKVEPLCNILLEHTNSKEELIDIYICKIEGLKATSQHHKALKTGVLALHLLGVHLPENSNYASRLKTYFQTFYLINLRRLADYFNLRKNERQKPSATMELLAHIVPIAYSVEPQLLPSINKETLKISLNQENSREATAMAYALNGLILCTQKRTNIKKGLHFGNLALSIYQEIKDNPAAYRTPYLVSNFIFHWGNHLKDSITLLKQIHVHSKKHGITEGVLHSVNALSYRILLIGDNFSATEKKLAAYGKIINKIDQKSFLHRQLLYQQVCDNLMGNNSTPSLLEGSYYKEKKYCALYKQENDRTSLFQHYLFQLILFYLFNDFSNALKSSQNARKFMDGVSGSVLLPYYYFYDSLTKLALLEEEKKENKSDRFIQDVIENQRILFHWSEYAPMNFLHKYRLIQAGYTQMHNDYANAVNQYDTAARLCHKHGYLFEEALCYEKAGYFLKNSEKSYLAKGYLQEARYRYFKLGALAKVRQLDRVNELHTVTQKKTAEQPNTSGLDMLAVIKASRALTEEVVLDNLLKKILQITIENAGAQKGFLLFEKEGEWFVRARGSIVLLDTHVTTINDEINNYKNELSQNIVHYVARTKEIVVLNNPTTKGVFIHDDYIINKRPKSILCTPVIHQGTTACILYLENNLTTRAFPVQHQEVINILGTQAAISLKNSTLYSDLGSTVEQLHNEIENHKETQRQLLHAEKLTALGRLSASIAHEFGNPLMGIKYLLEDFTQRLQLSKDDRELMQIGLDECNRMKSLMKDLHQLDKPSSGKMSKFDLHRTIGNVLTFQKKLFKTKKIQVKKELQESPLVITAVEDQITQVLINLLINAGDAISVDEGGEITISTHSTENLVTVLVHDTGSGIPIENQERIFEPFFSTKPEVEGTGLGLATSYGIITSHGGTISCSSSPEKGTIFKIQLPL